MYGLTKVITRSVASKAVNTNDLTSNVYCYMQTRAEIIVNCGQRSVYWSFDSMSHGGYSPKKMREA